MIIMALWNQVAIENSDYQKVLIKVHFPCATNIIAQNSDIALKTLQKLFISDLLKTIKAGGAANFSG